MLRRWAIGILVWGVAAAALSLSGALSRMPPLVPPALVVAGIAIPLLVVLRSPVQRAIVQQVDLAHLTWFNVWRVPAAAAFFALGSAACYRRSSWRTRRGVTCSPGSPRRW